MKLPATWDIAAIAGPRHLSCIVWPGQDDYAWLSRDGLDAGLSGLVVTDFFELAMAQHLPLHTAVQVHDSTSHYGLGIGMTGNVGAIPGLVLLAAAAWRARWVCWVPAAVIVAGWVVIFMGPALLFGGVGSGLVFAGLALPGARVLRAGNAEWEDGRPA